jgi:two-component system, LytTR family, response regulator AlgR
MARVLNVLIVDDEPLASARLAGLVQELPDCQVIGEAAHAKQAFAMVQAQNPDLVLLDIAMPGETGLALAARFQTLVKPPMVIFCTAFEAHALKAYEAKALDYLLKPVRRERLRESIERIQRLLAGSPAEASKAFVTASVGGVLRRIALDDIHFLQSDEKYTMAHHRGGEHVLDQTLKELEQQFPEQLIRIHRNCLVSQTRLMELRRDGEGRVWAVLKEVSAPLEVSRRCASDLKGWFKGV